MAGILRTIAERLCVLEPARDLRSAAGLVGMRLRWAAGRGFGRHDRRLVADYLNTEAVPALYLGAGKHELDGWLNSDLFPRSRNSVHLDATEQFPFADGTFRYVFSNHMIEHVSYPDAARMLAECSRVLEPGGTLRVATPDFAFMLAMYADPAEPLTASYIDWMVEWINRNDPSGAPSNAPMFVINNLFHDWGHRFIYDRRVLSDALQAAGFVDIVECDINESAHEKFRNISHEERAPPGFVRLETLTLEGTKPY